MKKLLNGILIFSLFVAGGYTALKLKGIERIEIVNNCSEKSLVENCPKTKWVQINDCLSNSISHDTHVARCYRCALGQNEEKANEDFCKEYYKVWNVSRDQAKDTCK